MDPTTESETPSKPILAFKDEFPDITDIAAEKAKRMLDAPETLNVSPSAPESEPDRDPLITLGRGAIIAVAILGTIASINLVGQTFTNAANHANTVAEATDAHNTEDSITTAINNASDGHGEGSQPIATFTIDADTPYISSGVEEFKNNPTATYATENDEEKGFDARSLSDSGKHLNATDPSNPGDTYGIFNDEDLDGDGDTDLHVEKIDPASIAPVVDQLPAPETR